MFALWANSQGNSEAFPGMLAARPTPKAAKRPSLSREQPPVARLAAVAQLELDVTGGEGVDLLVAQRRIGAAQARDELGLVGQALEHSPERLAWRSPHNNHLVHEPNRLPLPEAPLGVVARGGRARTRAYPVEGSAHRLGVLGRAPGRIEADGGHEPGLLGPGGDDLDRLLGELGGALGGQ